MDLQSFFGDTVQEAMASARRELGADAALVSSRKAGAEWRHLGEFEVVCTMSTSGTPVGRQTPPAPAAAPLEQTDQPQRASYLFHRLLELGLEASLAARIAAGARSRAMKQLTSRLDPPSTDDALIRSELKARVRTTAPLQWQSLLGQAIAMVGPSGSGKTTFAAKLAAQWLRGKPAPVRFVAADGVIPGSTGKLRLLSAVMHFPVEAAVSPPDLARLLTTPRQDELLIIDTPSLDAMGNEASQWIRLINKGIHLVILVLPAVLKPEDLQWMIGRYLAFQPASVCFTRLDETGRFGSSAGEALEAGLPFSYLSRGPRIPEDLEAATAESIIDAMFRSSRRTAESCR